MKKISDGDTAWTIVDVAHQINAILAANGLRVGLAYLGGTTDAGLDPSIVVGIVAYPEGEAPRLGDLVATLGETNVELWDVA